MINKLLIRN